MTSLNKFPTPLRALAIGAHPDDIDFQCGATLAKWATQGCEVSYLICTDGQKGTWDPNDDLEALVVTRQAEQRKAAESVGATGEIIFLDRIDGELENNRQTRFVIAEWIRRLQPDVVLAHDPWKRYRLHPDHRAAGFLSVDSVVAARDPHFFPEQGLAHHRPKALWLFEADEPDHFEDVSGFGNHKVDALMKHVSQFVTTMGIQPNDDGGQAQAFRRRILNKLATDGKPVGLSQAEAYKVIEPL